MATTTTPTGASADSCCSRCGTPIDGALVGGLCPACLLAGGRSRLVDEQWVVERFPQLEDPRHLVENADQGSSSPLRFEAVEFESGDQVVLHLFKAGNMEAAQGQELWADLERRQGLNHPRIARVREFGAIDEFLYAIEDAPQGQSLRMAIAEAAVDRADMLAIMPAITSSIRFAAERGISVGSDPDRVFISRDGDITVSSLALGDGDGDGKSGDGAVSWVEDHPAVGTRVGPYQLVELMGEGGFAEVYRARQEHPVSREVALKILKLGMDTRQVLARFARERQALARMSHSGIARIFDAGATAAGRPYIAMELVEGEPITSYCDNHKLSLSERASLFAAVCRAVEHGHERGVVHRDLKPSNVLVATEDGKPAPKVIDYGIARAAEEPLAANTFFTRTQQMIGSPSYMSPEQVGGGVEADARSDVYALGALLYHLLTGQPPLTEDEVAGQSVKNVIEQIESGRARHPADLVAGFPAERRSALAGARCLQAEELTGALSGPFSDIALKALSKKPADRYPDAAAMADDLESWVARGKVSAPRFLRRWQRKMRMMGLALVAIGLGWAGVVVLQSKSADPINRIVEDEPQVAPATPIVPAVYEERSRLPDGGITPVALFQFDDGLESAIEGGPDMIAWGDPALSYETATIAGGDAQVMKFPRFLPSQWLKFPNIIGPNGPPGAEETNSWTLVFDVMFPSITGAVALFQCHSENFGEAEVYVGPKGIGSRFGLFYGEIYPGEWYRIAIVSSHNNRAQLYATYVNGTRWGIPWVKGMLDAGYAFDDEILLFCEGDQRTASGFVNSIAMYDVPLTDEELHALGAPSAEGIPATLKPEPEAGGELLFAEARVVPGDVRRLDRFGTCVAAAGSEVWSAAPGSDAVSEDGGLVYRYRQAEEGSWELAGTIAAPVAEPSMYFGSAMAHSPEVTVIGAPLGGAGRAFLVPHDAASARPGTPTLLDPGKLPAGARFGTTVAVAGEAPVVVVGAPGLGEGQVYLFDPVTGEHRAEIEPPTDKAVSGFGAELAATMDHLAIGAGGVGESGAVWVWRQTSDGGWRDAVPLENEEGAQPGGAMAFSPDGQTLAVATPAGHPDPAVSVYRLDPDAGSGAWTFVSRMAPPAGNADTEFGSSLAWLSGHRLAVGSPRGSWRGRRTGVVHLYGGGQEGGSWEVLRTVAPREGTQDGHFGNSITVGGSEGELLWIGARRDQRDRPDGGACYRLRVPRFEDQRFPTAAPDFRSGSDVAIDGSLAMVGSPGIDSRVHGGTAQVFRLDPDSERWREEAIPKDPNPHPTGSFARVAINDRIAAGIFGQGIRFYSNDGSGWRASQVHSGSKPNDLTVSGPDVIVTWAAKMDFLHFHDGQLEETASFNFGDHRPSTVALDADTALLGRGSAVEVYWSDPTSESAGWKRSGRLELPGGGSERWFGLDVALSDGWALAGSPARGPINPGPGSGSAHFFRLEGAGVATHVARVAPRPETGEHPSFGSAVAIDGDLALVGNPLVSKGREPGRVEVFRYDPATTRWLHAETLQASNALPGDEFGIRVAIDNGWAVVGAKSNWVYFFRVDR